jgi:NADPH:quinone reductase-like Zn-dependent oxidoreductase
MSSQVVTEQEFERREAEFAPRATMKAVRIHAYGGPEVMKFEDSPRPSAGRGELLVAVHAAGVNPVDWKVREGHLKEGIRHKLPLILGWDFSGRVEETGPGASRFRSGDEVFGRADLTRDGSYAEFLAVDEKLAAGKPPGIDHVRAAAIPIAGLTAWQCLFDLGGLEAGQTILVHGAAGGVGSFAVQLAKWRGARVLGTASKRHAGFVKDLGADVVIDYRSTPFEEAAGGVDLVLDTIGGDTQERSWKTLKKGGLLVSTVQTPSAEKAKTAGARGLAMMAQSSPNELAEMGELAVAGKLRIPVETVLRLEEARRAHETSESGHAAGKIVLTVR